MTRRCMYCHVTASEPARLTLRLGRGDLTITIDGVPGHRCSNCGGESVDGPLAEELSAGVLQLTRAVEAALAVPAEV
jgi:YgiT-type zinc finger domain-containing protein